jgi:hypothetical protein
LAAGTFLLQQAQTPVEAPSVLLHEVGDEEGRTSRNASSTVDKHIACPPGLLDPLEGGTEGMSGVLRVAVVEVELQVDDILRVGEVQVHARTHSKYVVLP